MKAIICPIGHIETPYESIEDCPNNADENGPPCALIVNSEFKDAIFRLEPGQRILILYWFENADRDVTIQNSRKNGERSGVFALRTPNRPNPIGASIVKIERIEKNIIHVNGLDCLNGTPLIDIKPARDSELKPD